MINCGRTVKYCRIPPKAKEYQIISYQLIKSSTSSGDNYEEAQGSISSKSTKRNN